MKILMLANYLILLRIAQEDGETYNEELISMADLMSGVQKIKEKLKEVRE